MLLRAQNFQALGEEKPPRVYSEAVSNSVERQVVETEIYTSQTYQFRSPLDGSYCKFWIKGS